MAQNTISKLERGREKRPRYNTVLALARALRIVPESLRFGADPRTRNRPTDARRGRPVTTEESVS
jgi:transcriptional regulator with XRE-family HTH domain